MVNMLAKTSLQEIKNTRPHFPVLIREIIQYLQLQISNSEEKVYLDCTFGAGGYTESILQFPNTKVIALDRDTLVTPYVQRLKNIYGERFIFANETFSNYPQILNSLNIKALDGIVMDLGFSSLQLNDENRGFSFKNTLSLSMEMGLNERSAYNFVNNAKEDFIADILYHYGEERQAKKIAKAICSYRRKKKIESAKELADIIKNLVGSFGKIHPATRSFQAIRIYINDELQELQNALSQTSNYLKVAGRLLVVSFHSLEDRIVKEYMNNNGIKIKEKVTEESSFKKFTIYKPKSFNIDNKALFKIITKKPICPQFDEVKINPPSSSAKLRVVEKI